MHCISQQCLLYLCHDCGCLPWGSFISCRIPFDSRALRKWVRARSIEYCGSGSSWESTTKFKCFWLVVIIFQDDEPPKYFSVIYKYYASQSLVLILGVLVVHHYSYWTVPCIAFLDLHVLCIFIVCQDFDRSPRLWMPPYLEHTGHTIVSTTHNRIQVCLEPKSKCNGVIFLVGFFGVFGGFWYFGLMLDTGMWLTEFTGWLTCPVLIGPKILPESSKVPFPLLAHNGG